MRISSVVMRIEIAAVCECCNRVTQNSSFWVVHQILSFPTIEDRSSVSFHRKSLFNYKSTNKKSAKQSVSEEVAKHYGN